MEILLVNPPTGTSPPSVLDAPLGLGYLASVLLYPFQLIIRLFLPRTTDDGRRTIVYGPSSIVQRKGSFSTEKGIEDGYGVSALDLTVQSAPWEYLVSKVQEVRPDIVGVTAVASTFPAALRVAHLCKQIRLMVE